MKCSNCSNDMIQSKAGWLCMECGHIEMLSTDDKAKMAAAAPPPPAILGHASPVPEPAPSPTPPEPEPTPTPVEPEVQQPEVVEAPTVAEKPEEPEEPKESEAPKKPEEPKTDRKRLRDHHNDHAGLTAHVDKPDAPTPDAPAGPVPIPVIDVASVVGDAVEPESTVIDITPAESPEKVLEESIAEIQTVPEADAETDTQLEPQTALSSSPAVAAANPEVETPVIEATAETPDPPVETPPAPPATADSAPEEPITEPPAEAKPPLQPVTHPGSVTSKTIGVIAVVVVSLSVLGGAAVYASVTKSPALSWLTGSKPTQAVATATPAQTAAPTSTPVLAAEVTPSPSPAVPVNHNAQRIDDLAAYKAAYLATAKNGFFATTPPAVSVHVTEPSTGLAYVVSKAVPTALGQIQYWPGGVCSGAPKTPGTTGTKYLALQVMLEGSTTPYCVEVK